jgi:serine protease
MVSSETHTREDDHSTGGGSRRIAGLLAALAVPLLLAGGCGGGDSTPLPGGNASTAADSFTLSGTISVTAGTAVDSDVNDPSAPYAPNDTLGQETSQPLPNPVSVGGYVNVPGAGEEGRSQSNGDRSDFYRIDMTAGQTANLSIARFGTQLELFIYEGVGDTSPVQAGGSPQQRSYTVNVAGTYFLEVRAVAGASNYVLSVGQATSAAQGRGARLGDAFVPGDVIVKWRDDSTTARGVSTANRATTLGLEQAGGGPGRAQLLRLGETPQQVQAAFRALGIGAENTNGNDVTKGLSAEQRRKWQTLRVIRALREREDVVYAEPNHLLHPMLTPADPFYPLQWHYPQISLPQAWDLSTGATSVIVAVIDTGVVLSHPDLQGQLVQGYDFVRDPATSGDGDGIDPNPNDPGDQFVFSSYHGTHVAGTVAAATNNIPTPIGVAGTGWGLKIMPVRALTSTGGTEYDILQAVRYAAGLSNDSNTTPSQPADVINLSLGGEGYSQSAQDVFSQVRAKGIIVVAAAGNSASRTTIYPAGYTGVVAVSAVDLSKSLATYSSFGASIDLAAPGGDLSRDANGDGYPDGVLSTWVDDSSGFQRASYAFAAGTSMAAPHVAGVAGLMKSLDPGLTPQDFDDLLATGAITDDLGDADWDEMYGHGLIDAYKALSAVGAPASATPSLAAAPSAMNLGTTTSSAQLSLRNAGAGSLSVEPPREVPESDWLEVNADQIDANGVGTYLVTVNRSTLTEGTYSASIVFDWTGDDGSSGELSVPIIMQVGSNLRVDDAGRHYVLLLDEQTGDTLDQFDVSAREGRYEYAFIDVPPGRYLIVAGSDPDNDQIVCGAGEACGAYLTLDQLQVIDLKADRSGLDFVTSFEARVDSTGQGAEALGTGVVPLTPTPLPAGDVR